MTLCNDMEDISTAPIPLHEISVFASHIRIPVRLRWLAVDRFLRLCIVIVFISQKFDVPSRDLLKTS